MCEGEQRLIELVFAFLLIENILEKYIPFFNYTDEFITIFAIVGILFQGSKITINKYESKVLVSVFFYCDNWIDGKSDIWLPGIYGCNFKGYTCTNKVFFCLFVLHN